MNTKHDVLAFNNAKPLRFTGATRITLDRLMKHNIHLHLATYARISSVPKLYKVRSVERTLHLPDNDNWFLVQDVFRTALPKDYTFYMSLEWGVSWRDPLRFQCTKTCTLFYFPANCKWSQWRATIAIMSMQHILIFQKPEFEWIHYWRKKNWESVEHLIHV